MELSISRSHGVAELPARRRHRAEGQISTASKNAHLQETHPGLRVWHPGVAIDTGQKVRLREMVRLRLNNASRPNRLTVAG